MNEKEEIITSYKRRNQLIQIHNLGKHFEKFNVKWEAFIIWWRQSLLSISLDNYNLNLNWEGHAFLVKKQSRD